MALSMSDDELKKRIKDGTPIKILAELNGCSDATIYNWMKKNNITRGQKEEAVKVEQENPIDTPPEVDAVLDVLKENFASVKAEIDNVERRIEPLNVQLRIWSELIKEVENWH